MDLLIPSLVDGLLLGFVYGIAAMGLTLIWGVMNVINLAHGAIMALGMFGVYLFFTYIGIHPYIALVLVAGLGLLLGIVIYFIAVNRVIDAPHLSSLLSTFAFQHGKLHNRSGHDFRDAPNGRGGIHSCDRWSLSVPIPQS
jgi:branched-chain amino acid transport system permease protein